MTVLSLLFPALVIAGLCILAGSLVFGALFSREDPPFNGDQSQAPELGTRLGCGQVAVEQE